MTNINLRIGIFIKLGMVNFFYDVLYLFRKPKFPIRSLFKWFTKWLFCEEKTQSTELAMSDPDILMPKKHNICSPQPFIRLKAKHNTSCISYRVVKINSRSSVFASIFHLITKTPIWSIHVWGCGKLSPAIWKPFVASFFGLNGFKRKNKRKIIILALRSA